MKVFREFGERVEARWSQVNYDERVFPALASELLEAADLVGQVEPLDILRWVGHEPSLPEQQDAGSFFSDSAITLYDAPRFFVAAYFWLSGTTAIHQHGFCGAFQVLSGGSLHSVFHFRETRHVNGRFRLGALHLDRINLLRERSVTPILSGDDFIHSLFHLERPSVTICVRTKGDPGTDPQWSYLHPGISFDPFYGDPWTNKKLETASILLNLDRKTADPLLEELVASADLQTTFLLLQTVFRSLDTSPLHKVFHEDAKSSRFQHLLDVARRRHGRVVDCFPMSFEEEERQEKIIAQRGILTSAPHRFLLALFLNVPNPRRALELVHERYPERDPLDTVIEWVGELGNTKEFGSSAPNVLGIHDFDQEHLFVLRRLLCGDSEADVARRLLDEFPEETAESTEELARTICRDLRTSSFFQLLLDPHSRTAPPSTWEP